MVDFQSKNNYGVRDLEALVSVLRHDGGCPWDIKQTHESLRRGLLEEAYEVVEAIDQKSPDHLREELGDVLLQVVFHADIEKDAGNFDLDDVADGICKKLIYRHPHVFGNVETGDADEVLRNWDLLKRAEKNQSTTADAMESVAVSLPALWRAEKVQKKAAKDGVIFRDVTTVAARTFNELSRLTDKTESPSDSFDKLGDLLFCIVNIAEFLNIDPEAALSASTDRFIRRFHLAEERAARAGQSVGELCETESLSLLQS